jgi:hypothetical protein
MGNLDGPTVPVQQVSGFYLHCHNVTGPTWQYFGISPSTTHNGFIGGDASCGCFTPRFSVDDFGRTFLPDAFSFSVVVLDNNKNEILRFGDYGNPDQQGPGSAHPTPEIPLAWPVGVQNINNSVYVSDIGNRRVVRVKLGYAEWATTNGLSTRENPGIAMGKVRINVTPMPFRQSALIEIVLPGKDRAALSIYSPDGRLVRHFETQTALSYRHVFHWDGRDDRNTAVGMGMYVARVETNKAVYTKNLVLAK